jgi:hypothetical protein
MSSLKFGAKTMNDWTPQESLAPYIKAVVSSGAEVSPSRAVINKGNSGSITLTIGNEDVAIYLIQGEIYPISATKSSSNNIIFLY